MTFQGVDTKSPTEAVEVLFAQAVPSIPVISMEDILRVCSGDLNYDVRGGQRHVVGTADLLRPIVAWNIDAVPQQLYSGQHVIGYQVTVQLQLQFAALSIVVGDAQGSPGYMFGARVWRTTDQLFVQGWEGFQTSPPVSPSPAASVEADTPAALAPDSRATERAADVLIAELTNKSWEIRAAAAELMGESRERAVEAHMQLLKDKYPKPNQQAINAFDWRRKCQEIGDRHNLLDTEISGLQAEVIFVLMDLSYLSTLHTYIDVEIGGSGWKDIYASVVDDVISPIAEILEIIVQHDG